MYTEQSVPQTCLGQQEPLPFKDAAIPPDTSKYRKTLASQKEYFQAYD
jgi:hypothetical protein